MKDNFYQKDGHRYEQKTWPLKITVKTQHQGYLLEVGDTQYFYYKVTELFEGLAIHAGLIKEDFMTSEEMEQLMEAIINGTALKEALKEVVELKKVIKALKKELKHRRYEK